MNILVVDDSKAMRMIVKRTVKKAGFTGHEFLEAGNGLEAYKDHPSGTPPDLVLSDWNMPRMTGIALLERLKEEGISIKFGFVTSEGTKERCEPRQQRRCLIPYAAPYCRGFRRRASARSWTQPSQSPSKCRVSTLYCTFRTTIMRAGARVSALHLAYPSRDDRADGRKSDTLSRRALLSATSKHHV